MRPVFLWAIQIYFPEHTKQNFALKGIGWTFIYFSLNPNYFISIVLLTWTCKVHFLLSFLRCSESQLTDTSHGYNPALSHSTDWDKEEKVNIGKQLADNLCVPEWKSDSSSWQRVWQKTKLVLTSTMHAYSRQMFTFFTIADRYFIIRRREKGFQRVTSDTKWFVSSSHSKYWLV